MKKKLLLIAIIILATLVRTVDLGGNRPHLTNDEAALGYNAYSILQTARDEHGALLPVVFKSFGDWKPGLYVYTAVPAIAIFGLNEFSTRLPSVLFGIGAVFLLYLMTKRLTKDETIALFSSFFLAVSPWHITFSRGAWEANISLTLTLAALLALLTYLNNTKKKYLILSAVLFALTLWAYQSAKLFSLLLIIGVVLVYHRKISTINKKHVLVAGIVGTLISIPIIFSLLTGHAGRLNVMSVFSNARSDQYIEDTITSQGDDEDSLIFTVFHSEGYNFTRGILGRYFNHFAGRFLFFEGDWTNARHTSPNIGYLLLIDAPLLLLGFVFTAKNFNKKEFQFLFYYLAVSPLASAFSRDSVHGIRSLNMVIPLVIFVAIGSAYLLRKLIKYLPLAYILLIFLAGAYLFNFIFFLDAYFIHAPIQDSRNFLYGYKQIVQSITPEQRDHDEIVIDDNFDQAYIYLLFYQQYNPSEYQKTNNFMESKLGDVGKITKLDNITFRPINWSADKHQTGLVMVNREVNMPMYEIEGNVDYKLTRIPYLDGSPGFVIVEVVR